MHRKALRMSRFPCILPSPNFSLPYQPKRKDFCRSVTISTETKYFKFHYSTVTHLPIQGISILALNKAGFKNGRYDAENGVQSRRVIHQCFEENKLIKCLTKV